MEFNGIIASVIEANDIKLAKQVYDYLIRMKLTDQEKEVLSKLNLCLTSNVMPTMSTLEVDGSQEIIAKEDIMSSLVIFEAERKNKELARQLMSIATDVAKNGYDKLIHKRISDLTAGAVTSKKAEYSNPLDDALALYEDMEKTGSGMKFGVEVIDKAIGGITPGSFNVLFAFTGGYKTTTAVNIAYNNTFNGDYNVLYVSLEVVKKDLMWDIYSRHSFEMHSSKFNYLPHDKMRHAKLTEKEKEFLFKDVIPDYKKRAKGKLYLLDETDFDSMSFMGFEKRFREMENIAIDETGKGIDCIIVDQAQLLKYGGSNSIGNEGNVINAWVSFFREQCISFLGTERPIAVIMLSQANREGWKRAVKNEGRYDLRAISEANELERAAWRIFSVFTNDNMKEAKECKMQVLKNRTGLTVMDPVVVFADPVCYTVGDVASGFNDSLDLDSIDDIFSSEFDDSLFG